MRWLPACFDMTNMLLFYLFALNFGVLLMCDVDNLMAILPDNICTAVSLCCHASICVYWIYRCCEHVLMSAFSLTAFSLVIMKLL